MQVGLSSGGYDIISSGQVLLFGKEEEFKIDILAENGFRFQIVLKFMKDDTDHFRIEKKVVEHSIILDCYNFADTGTGMSRPSKVARIGERDVYFMFWSYLEGAEDRAARSVKYTIFMDGNKGESADAEKWVAC